MTAATGEESAWRARGRRGGPGLNLRSNRSIILPDAAPAGPCTPAAHTLEAIPPMNQQRLEERTQWVYDDRAFPIWNGSFERADRTEMIKDDLWAGRSIALLLAALVAVGLVLALVTLAFVANWR